MDESKQLKPRYAKFVAAFLSHGNATQAAIEVGYAPLHATSRAYKLMQRPDVKAAISVARKQAQENAVYNLEKAMAECDRTIAFSEKTDNANAMAKAVELKSKLNGLLVERIDHRISSGFVINMCIRPPTDADIAAYLERKKNAGAIETKGTPVLSEAQAKVELETVVKQSLLTATRKPEDDDGGIFG